MNQLILHQNRSLIEISGKDKRNFLQGLITNDINDLSEEKLLYSAILNPKGRFLYDIFLFEVEDIIFLECINERREEIFKKLKIYKLRSDVEIKLNDNFKIAQSLQEEPKIKLSFKDPRSEKLGYRIYIKNDNLSQANFSSDELYHDVRINNKICEGELDLTYEKSVILEFGFDKINAVSFSKGCYVGQELISRTHHQGLIRKTLYVLNIEGENLNVEKGKKIFYEEQEIGKILSSINYQGQLSALALLRNIEGLNFTQGTQLTILDNKTAFIKN